MAYQDELNVLIDALRDYAEGADDYEADPDDVQNRVIEHGETARELLARAEALRELPEEQLALMVKAAHAMAA